MVAHLELVISHGVNREENTRVVKKKKVVSLLLLFLLIFSHTEDPGLLSVIKISCFSAAVDSFCFIGNWILFDSQFFNSSRARN